MSYVYDTPKPSTWAALRYMGAVCRALWADHRASVRMWKRRRSLRPASQGNDVLYWLAVAAATAAAIAVLALTGFDLWADFSAWIKASGAALLLPTTQADRCRNMLRLRELANRPQGVSNAELQAELGISCKAAGQMLFRAGVAGLAKRRDPMVEEGRLRCFASAEAAAAHFAQRQAFPGVDIDRVQATAPAPAQAAPEALAAAPPLPQPRLARPKKRGQEIVIKRPSKAAQAALAASNWATTPAVMTPETRVTVAPLVTEGTRISRMADPLPGVPGWGKAPPVRPGAMDFKRHMHQAQAFSTPAHTIARPGGHRG